ncbi:DUF397 domain-containing protein [Streptomyces globisporus]|uniref:DUF397 domain-containing protein n=1 Tax=Streptomyces globisporus TaxID=1908 RepID=UPI003793D810
MSTEEPAGTVPELAWLKSSYSTGSGGECVEVANAARSAHVRDSKNRPGHAEFRRGALGDVRCLRVALTCTAMRAAPTSVGAACSCSYTSAFTVGVHRPAAISASTRAEKCACAARISVSRSAL